MSRLKYLLIPIGLLAYLAIMLFGNIWEIDLLFTLTAIGGALFTIYNIQESYRAYLTLKKNDTSETDQDYNPRLLVATNSLRAEGTRLVIQAIFATIGIYAMFLPSGQIAMHLPVYITVFQYLFRWGLIVSSLLLTLKSYWGYKLRRRVLEHYRNWKGK